MLVWQTRAMVTASVLLHRDDVAIADVSCRHRRRRGRDGDEARHHAVVFVRRGCFVRSVDGVQHLLDPTRVYCTEPGQEQRYDHPLDHGDDCTAITLRPGTLASLWGGDPSLPCEPVSSSPAIDLEHRLLLAASRRGEDAYELTERAILLVAAALEQADPRRVAAGRPATVRARRSLADSAHEALAADPDRSLPELAADLGGAAPTMTVRRRPRLVIRGARLGTFAPTAHRLTVTSLEHRAVALLLRANLSARRGARTRSGCPLGVRRVGADSLRISDSR